MYKIQKTAEDYFHIHSVKPYQLLVMQRILEQEKRREVKNQIVILPTGTGKSLCFLLPASILQSVTVIVYPLLALMNDQAIKLKKNNIDCVILRGGQTKIQRKQIFDEINKGTKIIVTNPETLNQQKILNKLKEIKIGLLVVDEAHVISQWGKSFRPAYSTLQESVKQLKVHQILAFTATASQKTVDDITTCLLMDDPIVVRGDADRENIYYCAFPTLNRVQAVKQILNFCQKPAIVFCRKRRDTYKLCYYMKKCFPSVPMRYYHAGLDKAERENLEDYFLNCHDGVLFTTCAYGMGIDKPDIRTVIHSELPSTIEEYLQESGRVGRDRRQSYAFAIVTNQDTSDLAQIFKGSNCRRYELLKQLGQEKNQCTGCDVCNNSVIVSPYGQKIINQFIKLFPCRFTSKTAAELLCGVSYDPVSIRNPYYGVLDYEPQLLQEAIDAMPFKKLSILKKHNLLYKKRTH